MVYEAGSENHIDEVINRLKSDLNDIETERHVLRGKSELLLAIINYMEDLKKVEE